MLFKHASVGNPISVNIVKISTSDLKMTDRQSGEFLNEVCDKKCNLLNLLQFSIFERNKIVSRKIS